MATADTPEKNPIPYIPFATFANFVERLKSTAIPAKIDNTVMPNLAGGVRGQVRSALRFLGLTDPEDHVTTTFRDLVQAYGTESWAAALRGVIESAYEPILNGLDLTEATPGQLQSKMRAAGVTGQMADKTIRFMLAAFESAGRVLSPHLSNRSAITSGKTTRRTTKPRRAEAARGANQEDVIEEAPSAGPGTRVRSFNFPIPGEPDIRVVIPEKLDDPDVWEMVNMTLRSYIKLNAKAKGTGAGSEGGGP
jgi:hypothetical protein